MTYRKKLIEVALPLEAINAESAREKSIRHGHPSTLHLWWARRPLAACRAVLWASLVDDPASWPEKFPTEEAQNAERQRLFDILARFETEIDKKGNQKQVVRGLVSWDEVNDPKSPVLAIAQKEIARCLAWERGEEPPTELEAVREYIARYAPPAYDPFAGGGSIPLEAQRLGLEAHASDLNPVAVLINKALIEIPPKFRDQSPINPADRVRAKLESWQGAQGLAADVRYYGQWMRDEAFKQIGHLYPKVRVGAPHPPAPSPTRGEGGQDKAGERWEISDALRVKMTEVARGLRREATQSEAILWDALRAKKLDGRKFRRQEPIGPFVVDFFCAAERLIVEIDGAIHDSQQERDAERQSLLESLGLRFVRLTADAVETNLPECLKQIQGNFTTPTHNPPTPLSPGGRGAGGEGAKGEELTVIAWLWARTVQCPNPACGCQMPLVRSFQLSTKKGKEAWVEPVIDRSSVPPIIGFEVKMRDGEAPEGTVERKGARCIVCDMPVPLDYVRGRGKAGQISQQLMAIVAEGKKSGRVYLVPDSKHELIAAQAKPKWKPESELPQNPRNFNTPIYGMDTFDKLFTSRQLVALNTFSDLISDALTKAVADAIDAGLANDDIPLDDDGTGARAYGEAISIYLGMALSRLTDICNALCRWEISKTQVRNLFGRQAIPMVWDFAENNVFANAAGDFLVSLGSLLKVVERMQLGIPGITQQKDAVIPVSNSRNFVISSDPPYYDNIGYADLSDFFYVWLRRTLQPIYPDLFSTLLVPKTSELVATPYRFDGDKQKAKVFFEEGLGNAFNQMHEISDVAYPTTIYYAFKQSEAEDKGETDESMASTGWETMLEGLIQADFTIGGTWLMRSELSNRMIADGTNALASSIVLVCRPRPTDAPKATRRQFTSELKRELPPALRLLQQGNIAPVDLAQASIGPGMAIYSKYAAVLEADGSSMRVRAALQLINQILDEYLTEQEGEFDGDTRWALTWFEQHQFNEGIYGDAETLSKAKNTSVQGLVEAGILEAKAGKVRLLPRSELATKWQPDQDERMPVWEITQHLIRALDQTGETGAAAMLAKLGDRGSLAKDLAYRLYSLCDRKGWTQEALAYNTLVISWPEIVRLAQEYKPASEQISLSL